MATKQLYLSDQKALRRFDFEQNIASNRKSKTQANEKTKKQHLIQKKKKADVQKKKRKVVKKTREASEEVEFVRYLMRWLRIPLKVEYEHRKFKGEFGLFWKDIRYDGKKRHEHNNQLLLRYPNELRHNNCLTTMQVFPEGSWCEMTKDKKIYLLLRIEITKEWEINAADNVNRDECDFYPTEEDLMYPPSESSSDEEDTTIPEPTTKSKVRIVHKWYLIETALNPKQCSCKNFSLKNLYDDREIDFYLERSKREKRRTQENKSIGIPLRLNSRILEREEKTL